MEVADVPQLEAHGLECAILVAVLGPSRPCRAKQVAFSLLLLGHRVARSMVVSYNRMCPLAQLAWSPSTAQTVGHAIWEQTDSPKAAGLLRRALHEFGRLGWQCTRAWWQWNLPRMGRAVHPVHAPKEYVEHLFRVALRGNKLASLEKRRLRTFGGMGARRGKETMLG